MRTKLNQIAYLIPLLSVVACGNGGQVDNSPPTSATANPNPGAACPYAIQESLVAPAALCQISGSNSKSNSTIPQNITELNSKGLQVANGCSANSNNFGSAFTKSVVGMFFPRGINPTSGIPDHWSVSCTGTVIDHQWILTAGHCVAGADPGTGNFYPEEATIPLYIVPWQSEFNGIPTRIYESTPAVKFPVAAIYVAANFNYYGESWPNPLPYEGYLKADFALLKLESALPDNYQVIDLASGEPLSQTQVWLVGYGLDQNQEITGALNYRNIYYMTNIYPGNQGRAGNYGEVYTLGTLQRPYESYAAAAWKFSGNGDSGGATYIYNPQTDKFSVLGTDTGGLYCSYAGFFAPLPYPYTANASMAYYYNLVYSIINGTVAPSAVRCVSPSGKC